MSRSQGPVFKVKHRSGRVLGPLDLDRIKKLIERGEITGEEIAKAYPDETWKDVNLFPEIAALLLAQARGTIQNTDTLSSNQSSYRPIMGGDTEVQMAPTIVLPPEAQPQETVLLDSSDEQRAEKKNSNDQPGEGEKTQIASSLNEDPEKTVFSPASAKPTEPKADAIEEEKTEIGTRSAFDFGTVPSIQLATQFFEQNKSADKNETKSADQRIEIQTQISKKGAPTSAAVEKPQSQPLPYALTVEKTAMIQRPEAVPKFEKKVFRNLTGRELLRVVLLAGLLGYFGYESFLTEEKPAPGFSKSEIFRPEMPQIDEKSKNPKLSEGLYAEGLTHYFKDHVVGYRVASKKFKQAVEADSGNLKAVAMLASSYINLIDTSNKDEKFFAVINRLLDIIRTKGIDLTESLIAEVEYLVETNRSEAAVERIIEFTRTHPQFDTAMFYYISYAYFAKGDDNNAAKYIAQYPDNKAFSAKVFFLRAKIADKLGDRTAAKLELKKALKLNPDHMHSRLYLLTIANTEGRTKDMGQEIEAITQKGALLPPKDLALVYYYYEQYFSLLKKYDFARQAISRSIELDRGNHDYLLEYYTLMAITGEKIESTKNEIKMYVFLREGEKLLKDDLYHDALTQFLKARDVNPSSPYPYIKIGDMFWNLHDIVNARLNYEKAVEGKNASVETWSKYIRTLIESFEWDAAQKAMEKFRQLPVGQSAVDKLSGDMYAKQGRLIEASTAYRKAMQRDSIDPDVYLEYGKLLVANKQFKEAPFYFALARRLDPLNTECVILSAKAIANSESVDAGIKVLQNEIQKGVLSKSELLTAIAELNVQKGEYASAQNYLDQARSINPDLAQPWKVQAQIYLSRVSSDKKALDKALDAYKSYSDRNTSDPTGYLERFDLYRKKLDYDHASEELTRVFNIYPKYPNLHYYKGIMYDEMGNKKAAVDELFSEIQNNPGAVSARVALGRILVESGNAKDALPPLQKAMEIDPNHSQARFWAAITNHRLKNYQGAIALFRSAAGLDSGNPLIYKRMGECYREMGDMDSARAAFRKYLDMEPDAQDRSEIEKYL